MQDDSQESFVQPECEEPRQPLPPGWNEANIPPVLLALARRRPLEPLERAAFELLLQIPDEWTDQTLTLGAVREAGLQRLLEAGLIEAVIEVTVSFPTWGSGLKTHTHLFRATGRDCREAATAAGVAAAKVKRTRRGLTLSSQAIQHRLSVQGAEAIHDLWNGEVRMKRYARNWVLVEFTDAVVTRVSGPRPPATGLFMPLSSNGSEPSADHSSPEIATPPQTSCLDSQIHQAAEPPPAPAKPLVVELSPVRGDVDTSSSDDLQKLTNEDRAIALLAKDSTLSIAQLAKTLGVNPKTPYRWMRFMAFYKALQSPSGYSVRRGMKDGKTGEVTVFDEDDEFDDKDD